VREDNGNTSGRVHCGSRISRSNALRLVSYLTDMMHAIFNLLTWC